MRKDKKLTKAKAKTVPKKKKKKADEDWIGSSLEIWWLINLS